MSETMTRQVRLALTAMHEACDGGFEVMPDDCDTLLAAGLVKRTMRDGEPWYELNERGKLALREALR